MTIIFAAGGPHEAIGPEAMRRAIRAAVAHAQDASRTLVLPPDGTRPHSGAGALTAMLHEELAGAEVFHVMPALGTHAAMGAAELRAMFGEDIPIDAFLEHRWREDLVRLGAVPSEYVHQVSKGALRERMPEFDVPVEVNRRIVEGGYSAIFSVGQVVPHEVAGMANGVKNVLVGAGGQETINRTHFLGAVYGMERMMGRAGTPVRRVLDYAAGRYLSDAAILYVMTVIERNPSGEMLMRGLYVGDDADAFRMAAALSRQVNVTTLEAAQTRVVAYLETDEFHSTWLGNKAIYRTRMAIADGGELLVLAPGVRTFGEDPQIDRLVRRYGYRGTPATLDAVAGDEELRRNLSAAAHLIHGSSEDRFRVVYATDPDLLSREEVQSVGFAWRDVREALRQYDPTTLRDGPNDGFYYVGCPALGLWMAGART